MKKKLIWILSLLLVAAPLFSGCGIFHPPLKDSDGYYSRHFNCCGPVAIEAAINHYYHKQGIVFYTNPAPRNQISKRMQDDGIALKRFLSFFDRGAVCATWSWEMEKAVGKYGFKLVDVDEFEKLDPSKDIAFILVRGKFISQDWHWMCYPVDKDIKNYFGSKTKIDKILLLKKKI
jgi:hypothetical protein